MPWHCFFKSSRSTSSLLLSQLATFLSICLAFDRIILVFMARPFTPMMFVVASVGVSIFTFRWLIESTTRLYWSRIFWMSGHALMSVFLVNWLVSTLFISLNSFSDSSELTLPLPYFFLKL